MIILLKYLLSCSWFSAISAVLLSLGMKIDIMCFSWQFWVLLVSPIVIFEIYDCLDA